MEERAKRVESKCQCACVSCRKRRHTHRLEREREWDLQRHAEIVVNSDGDDARQLTWLLLLLSESLGKALAIKEKSRKEAAAAAAVERKSKSCRFKFIPLAFDRLIFIFSVRLFFFVFFANHILSLFSSLLLFHLFGLELLVVCTWRHLSEHYQPQASRSIKSFLSLCLSLSLCSSGANERTSHLPPVYQSIQVIYKSQKAHLRREKKRESALDFFSLSLSLSIHICLCVHPKFIIIRRTHTHIHKAAAYEATFNSASVRHSSSTLIRYQYR